MLQFKIVKYLIVDVVTVGGHAAHADSAASPFIYPIHHLAATVARPDLLERLLVYVAEAELLVSAKKAAGIHLTFGPDDADEVWTKALLIRA